MIKTLNCWLLAQLAKLTV